MKNEQTHLVPLVKSAVSVNKGLVVRTYHVTPERLKKYIEENKNRFSKKAVKLPFSDKISAVLRTKDITELYDVFSDKEHTWRSVVERHDISSSIHTYEHKKQLLFQNIYAFFITSDDITTQTVRKKFTSAHKNTKYSVIENQQELQKQNKAENDYGTKITKLVRTETYFESIDLGRAVSKFINYINPEYSKINKIMMECSFMNETNTPECSENFMFPLGVYRKASDFWTPLLTRDYITTMTDDNPYNDGASTLYHALVLYLINKPKALKLFKTYMNSKLEFILTNIHRLDTILYTAQLDLNDKEAVLAGIPLHFSAKNRHTIDMAIDAAYQRNETDKAFTYIHSAYSMEQPLVVANKIAQIDKRYFDVHNALDEVLEVQKSVEKPGINYFLLQLVGAVLSKMHYVPYNKIDKIYGGVFAPRTVNKIYKIYENLVLQQLSKLLNNNSSQKVKIGLLPLNYTIPADGQVFVKVEPFHKFEIYDNSKREQYIAVGEVSLSDVAYQKDNDVLVYNALKTVKFQTV